jgi:hypothetical protein
LWLPAGDRTLSINTSSLVATLLSESVKRETRLTGLVLVLFGQVPCLRNV